jgi:hypothetical protein
MRKRVLGTGNAEGRESLREVLFEGGLRSTQDTGKEAASEGLRRRGGVEAHERIHLVILASLGRWPLN